MVEKPMNAEDLYLQQCKAMVQAKLGWESEDSWTNHDFQMLCEKIQEETGVNLSVATLKRVWGKVKYESKPAITTLNTLAQFTGYENWRAFKQANSTQSSNGNGNVNGKAHPLVPDSLPHEKVRPSRKRNLWRSGLVGTALCGGIVLILFYGVSRDHDVEKIPSEYAFSSKKVVSEGVPNSVIFDYDATAAPVDSVFIQQSWNESLRRQVPRDQHQHTSIYYTPGFFKAKLVVGKEVVKEHNLLITSKGWLALVDQGPVPVYFKDEDFKKPGMLSLPIEKLEKSNLLLQPETPGTSYYNVSDFGNIRTDNFVFETEVRSDYKGGSGVCQKIQILLLTEGNVIVIPLSIKGCVSDLFLLFGSAMVDGKKADLSAFGCDVSEWVKIRCEAHYGKGTVYINDKMAFQSEFPEPDKIVGMIFRFQGTGSINEVKLASFDQKTVFQDDFN